VLIIRRYAYRGTELVVIPQPDGSVACIPAWMVDGSAARRRLCAEPRLSLDILRSLRAEVDTLLGFLHSDSGMEEVRNEAQERKSSARPVRRRQATGHTGSCSEATLAMLVEVLLREIATALAAGEVGDDQDHG
jgi:hypothetical protein